ncbi:MAG: ROK family protein [Colwellia sp.]
MIRIGIDFGGTKIEAAAIDQKGEFITRVRAVTPDDYESAINIIRYLVTKIENELNDKCSVGLCIPGSVCVVTQQIKNSNKQYLNGSDLIKDVEYILKRPIKIANDANCFALSEAYDGAGEKSSIVCGIILGTGCGGGIVVNNKLLEGRNGIAAEWGHNPLPWANYDEANSSQCYCGLTGCLEQWISGTALSRRYEGRTKSKKTAKEIAELAETGESTAIFEISALTDRIGRAIASICNVIDPDVIVLGGGLSNIKSLYSDLPEVIEKYIFNEKWYGQVMPPVWGDSSGVRGAARLWD